MAELAKITNEEEIVPVYENDNKEIIVSGRELHAYLGIKTRYDKWIDRMISYGFTENVDYILVAQKRPTNNPKNPVAEVTDHHLKLEMAKEIAMIQRSEKGKQARKYFLKCEKRLAEVKEDNRKLLTVAKSDNEQLERTRQAELIQYSTRNIHDIIFNSTYKNLDENVDKILSVNANRKKEERYLPDRKLTATEFLQKVRGKVSQELDDLSNLTRDSGVRVIADKINKRLKDNMLTTQKRSSSHFIYYRDKKINKKDDQIEKLAELTSQAIDHVGKVDRRHNPPLADYQVVNIHGFSENYMTENVMVGDRIKKVTSKAYRNWQDNFPADQLKVDKSIDWEKPVEFLLKFDCVSKMDVINLDKTFVDEVCRRLQVDDKNVSVHCSVNKYVNTYADGKIYYIIRQNNNQGEN